MDDDLLSKCVVDTSKRKIYLYSDDGKENVVDCDTVDEVMSCLNFVRDMDEEERVFYSDPLCSLSCSNSFLSSSFIF